MFIPPNIARLVLIHPHIIESPIIFIENLAFFPSLPEEDHHRSWLPGTMPLGFRTEDLAEGGGLG